MTEITTEIAIAGAGLTGCTLANLLCRNGLTCTVIDAGKSVPAISRTPDPRALAITPASARILSSIRVWQKIPPEKTGFFSRIHVWEEHSRDEIRFDSAAVCEPVLAYIVEQSLLQTHLDEAMTYLPGLSLIRGNPVVSFTREKGKFILELGNGDRVHAALFVAADGSHSPTRSLAGIEYVKHDYRQKAIACVVKTGRPHRNIARQRFLDSGPLAFLPMADGRTCGVVWSTGPDHARELLEMSGEDFGDELRYSIDSRLGEILETGPRASFELFRGRAKDYIADRFVLVGDAAHSVHPLAGQGANMGFLDVAVLAQGIIAAKGKNRNIGSRSVLRGYERWRKGENIRMTVALDGLKHLFEQKRRLVVHARGAGLNMLDSLPWVKNRIMLHAMGLEGELPDLVRQSQIQELT